MRAHIFNVDGGADHLYIVQGELRSLRDNPAVECYHGAAIIVEPVTVTALLVGIEVDSTKLDQVASEFFASQDGWLTLDHLESGFLDEFYTAVEFAKLVVATTGIRENLDTIQAHENVRAEDQSTMRDLWRVK